MTTMFINSSDVKYCDIKEVEFKDIPVSILKEFGYQKRNKVLFRKLLYKN